MRRILSFDAESNGLHGAVFAIGFIIWNLKGGFGQFWSTAMAEDKMHLFDFSFDLTKATVSGSYHNSLRAVSPTIPNAPSRDRIRSTKSRRCSTPRVSTRWQSTQASCSPRKTTTRTIPFSTRWFRHYACGWRSPSWSATGERPAPRLQRTPVRLPF